MLLAFFTVLKVPGGIVLSQGATVKITLLEVFLLSYNGWLEIEFFGIEDLELLNQLLWKKGEFLYLKKKVLPSM